MILLAAQLDYRKSDEIHSFTYKIGEILFDWGSLLCQHLLWNWMMSGYGNRIIKFIVFHLSAYALIGTFAFGNKTFREMFNMLAYMDTGATELDLVHSYFYENLIALFSACLILAHAILSAQ